MTSPRWLGGTTRSAAPAARGRCTGCNRGVAGTPDNHPRQQHTRRRSFDLAARARPRAPMRRATSAKSVTGDSAVQRFRGCTMWAMAISKAAPDGARVETPRMRSTKPRDARGLAASPFKGPVAHRLDADREAGVRRRCSVAVAKKPSRSAALISNARSVSRLPSSRLSGSSGAPGRERPAGGR